MTSGRIGEKGLGDGGDLHHLIEMGCFETTWLEFLMRGGDL